MSTYSAEVIITLETADDVSDALIRMSEDLSRRGMDLTSCFMAESGIFKSVPHSDLTISFNVDAQTIWAAESKIRFFSALSFSYAFGVQPIALSYDIQIF